MIYPTKRLPGYRFVSIPHGDTLQALAQRELGDVELWREIVAINDLVPPYLTGDPLLAGPKVRLYGQEIVVPAATVQVAASTDPNRVFGVDLSLNQGRLEAAGGDLALVGGLANLRQAINHRIATPLRELLAHPNYGCGVHAIKGEGADPTSAALGAKYVEGALLSDNRILSVDSASTTINGDAAEIVAVVRPKVGTSVDILTTV